MEPRVAVIGGANIDVCVKSSESIIFKDSNIGKVDFALGGVGRNIAEDLSLFGVNASLLTAIGDDNFGRVVSDNADEQNITLLEEPFENSKTGVYTYITDSDGSFVVGVNDMDITSKITPEIIERNINTLYFSDYVVLESNLNEDTIEKICSYDFKLIADCVSGVKCHKLKSVLPKLYLLKANEIELKVLTGEDDLKKGVKKLVEMGVERAIVTLGHEGAMCFEKTSEGIVCYQMPNMPGDEIIDTSGCGDAFLAGFIFGIIRNHSFKECLVFGQSAACLNSQSFSSVNREMSYTKLKGMVARFNEKTEVVKEIIK